MFILFFFVRIVMIKTMDNNELPQITPSQTPNLIDNDHGPRSGHELLSWKILVVIVVVGAFFLHSYLRNVPEEGIDPVPVVNMDEDQFAGWQTYRNEEFGFEVRYPDIYNIDLSNPDRTRLEYYISKDETETLLEGEVFIEIFRSNPEKLPAYETYINIEEKIEKGSTVTIRGLRTKPVLSFYPGYDQFTLNNNDLWVIAASHKRNDDSKIEEIKQIMDSFILLGSIDTSNWQTYRNEGFGFEVRYPEGWSVQGNGKYFISPEYRKFWDKNCSGPPNDCAPEAPRANIIFNNESNLNNANPGSNTVKVFNEISFNVYLESGLFDVYYYETSYGPKIYNFSGFTEGDEKILRQILSTFRFIGQIDTSTGSSRDSVSDWRTYRNDEFGFEVKYPEGWYLDESFDFVAFKDKTLDYNFENPLPLSIKLENTTFTNVSDWFNSVFVNRRIDHPLDVPERVTIEIDNKEALSYVDPIQLGSTTAQITIIRDSVLYKLAFSIDKNQVDQVLSTFKFLE